MTATLTIATRLHEVRKRIRAACERARRDPRGVVIVGVTKTHPLAVVREALAAGLADLGENRAQELLPKAEAAAAAGLDVRWHFVGHLQRNKVRAVLPHIAVLHSLDSERLLHEIARQIHRAGRDAAEPLPCYVEVNVGGEAQKYGVAPEALPPLLRAAAAVPALDVRGLMTVAPRVADPEEVRPAFRRLRLLAEAHGLPGLSMGMTDDFEVAVEEGATVVRIGRAIFGERPARHA